MTEYVCGFLIWKSQVLLIEKTKPFWQRGLLSGIGGKVEPGEEFDNAMYREWMEEMKGMRAEWRKFCEERGHGYECHFYVYNCSSMRFRPEAPAKNDVGERTSYVHVDLLHNLPVVRNLRWLIPMALDDRLPMARVET